MSSPHEKLVALNTATDKAALLMRPHAATIAQFEEERRHFESVGPFLDPTLWNSAERRRVSELLAPVYAAAGAFLTEVGKAQEAATGMLFEERRR